MARKRIKSGELARRRMVAGQALQKIGDELARDYKAEQADRRKGPRPLVVEIYPDKGKSGRYRWRFLAGNGAIIGDGSEGYNRERDAVRAAKRAVKLLRGPLVLTCTRRGLPVREVPANTIATKWRRLPAAW